MIKILLENMAYGAGVIALVLAAWKLFDIAQILVSQLLTFH